jgi:hypothetical protein
VQRPITDATISQAQTGGFAMLFKHDWIPAAAAVLALIGSITTQAQAQTALVSYAAKFVCGPRTVDISVVKGQYETTVNIHNPHLVTIQFRKKAVIALPQSSPPGLISNFVQEVLTPDQALGVNCRDIRALFAPVAVPAFIEGFLVIYIDATRPIDVIEVHTARHRGTVADGSLDVESIDTRQVDPLRVVVPTP